MKLRKKTILITQLSKANITHMQDYKTGVKKKKNNDKGDSALELHDFKITELDQD